MYNDEIKILFLLLHFDSCVISISSGPFAEKSVFCTENNGELRGVARSLQAYLCAGVTEWASENPIDTLGSSAVSSDRNGTANEETVCEDCRNKSGEWHGVLELLKISKNAILAKENLQYFQDCVKIKKWEHEIATAFAKSQKPVGDMASAVDDANDNGDTDGVLLKLEELKRRKQVFERDYISSPNPFVTYCRIKNILFHIKEEDPKSCGDLCEQFEALWESITSHI
jgi:hypothetical protein